MTNEKVLVVGGVNTLIDPRASLEAGKGLLKRFGVAKLSGAVEYVRAYSANASILMEPQRSDAGLDPDEMLMWAMGYLLRQEKSSPKAIEKNLEIAARILDEEWQPVLANGAIGLLDNLVKSRWPLVFLSDGGERGEKVYQQLNERDLRFDPKDEYLSVKEVREEWGKGRQVVMVSRDPLAVMGVKIQKGLGFLVTSPGFTRTRIMEAAQAYRIPHGDLVEAHTWLLKTISRKKGKK